MADSKRPIYESMVPKLLMTIFNFFLSQECSFVLYSDYTIDITDPNWNKNFLAIVENPAVSEALKVRVSQT